MSKLDMKRVQQVSLTRSTMVYINAVKNKRTHVTESRRLVSVERDVKAEAFKESLE